MHLFRKKFRINIFESFKNFSFFISINIQYIKISIIIFYKYLPALLVRLYEFIMQIFIIFSEKKIYIR